LLKKTKRNEIIIPSKKGIHFNINILKNKKEILLIMNKLINKKKKIEKKSG
jgi:hypothetical protein